MKLKNIILPAALGALTLVGTTACTGDLDQYPHIEKSSGTLYDSIANYESVLGKIYTSMVVVGQGKGGNADLETNMGYDYMRLFINLQECGTDEMAQTWTSGDKTGDLSYLTWDASDPWVSDMYYRIFYNITLCNEFLRNCTDSKISSFSESEQQNLKIYRAEARFMRALFYYHAVDFFHNIPFVTDADPIGSYQPPRKSPAEVLTYVKDELKDCAPDMLSRSECPYGRASQGAAYTLLAKIYLNQEVLTGTAQYDSCRIACEKVMEMGYTLEDDYTKLFNADNDRRTNEIIFALPVDADHTVSWGATTYLTCGQVSTSRSLEAADLGITQGWSMFRVRGELPAKFESGDKRALFHTDGQTQYLDNALTDETGGYLAKKWSNLSDEGTAASNTASDGCSNDFPLFRLADVYLMYAEAIGRLKEDWTPAIEKINALQQRAGLPGAYEARNFATDDAFLQFILDERARELYLEGTRRTDLVRYDQFTTNKYIWQWKGGTKDGMAVASKYNYYPIPSTELTANPNLKNEEY